MDTGKTDRFISVVIAIVVIFVIGVATAGVAFGNYLARIDEAQRHAIVQERGGEPICAGPDGSVYVKYPGLQKQSGSQG